MEAEIKKLEQEEAELLESVRQVVGEMSDLRYGRLSSSTLRETVIDSLNSVQETCKKKS